MKTAHFYPELAAHFPQLPNFAFDRALNISARTLCRIGLVWREDLWPVSWRAGEAEYHLYLPPDSRIVQLLALGDLEPSTIEQLTRSTPAWRAREGKPRHYVRRGEDVVIVTPVPTVDEAEAATPHVALAPTAELKELSDAFAWDYERLLLFGAVAHLGGAAWGDFERECRLARSRATDNNHVGVARSVRYGGL